MNMINPQKQFVQGQSLQDSPRTILIILFGFCTFNLVNLQYILIKNFFFCCVCVRKMTPLIFLDQVAIPDKFRGSHAFSTFHPCHLSSGAIQRHDRWKSEESDGPDPPFGLCPSLIHKWNRGVHKPIHTWSVRKKKAILEIKKGTKQQKKERFWRDWVAWKEEKGRRRGGWWWSAAASPELSSRKTYNSTLIWSLLTRNELFPSSLSLSLFFFFS